MTNKQLIDELSKLNQDENVEYDYITTSGVIELAKEQFDKVITKDEADKIICTIAEDIDGSLLQDSAWNVINNLLKTKSD